MSQLSLEENGATGNKGLAGILGADILTDRCLCTFAARAETHSTRLLLH